MSTNHFSNSPTSHSSSTNGTAPTESLDGAVLKLAAEAAFLKAFADNLTDLEVPVETISPSKDRGEIDFGWRAGLRF